MMTGENLVGHEGDLCHSEHLGHWKKSLVHEREMGGREQLRKNAPNLRWGWGGTSQYSPKTRSKIKKNIFKIY